MRQLDLEITREKQPLEFHCFKNNRLRRYVVGRTDKPNFQWHFKSLEDAIAHARKHASGIAGALFCEVDSYGCVERTTRLD
jgi:hypothetical protein